MARQHGAELLRVAGELADKLETVTGELRAHITTIGDPTSAEVQIAAAQAAAQRRASAAEAEAADAVERARDAEELARSANAAAEDLVEQLAQRGRGPGGCRGAGPDHKV